jgi:hypothetical protein
MAIKLTVGQKARRELLKFKAQGTIKQAGIGLALLSLIAGLYAAGGWLIWGSSFQGAIGHIITAFVLLFIIAVAVVHILNIKLNFDSLRDLEVTPIDRSTQEGIFIAVREGLIGNGSRLDICANGSGATNPAVNKILLTNRPALTFAESTGQWLAYDEKDHSSNQLKEFVLDDATHKGRRVSNDSKIRLETDITAIAGNMFTGPYELKKTDYLSGLMTNDIAWAIACRTNRPTMVEPQDIASGGIERFLELTVENNKLLNARLKDLRESDMSNQIGVSTLAFSSKGHLMIVLQRHEAVQSGGLDAPSGSGSLDWSDIVACRKNSPNCNLIDLIEFGAKRELMEECGLKEDECDVRLFAYTRAVHRGGKPEFYCIGRIYLDSLSITRRSDREFYTRDVSMLGSGRISASVSIEQKLGVLFRSLAVEGYDTTALARRARMSFPLEHAGKLLVEACADKESLEAITTFLLPNIPKN